MNFTMTQAWYMQTTHNQRLEWSLGKNGKYEPDYEEYHNVLIIQVVLSDGEGFLQPRSSREYTARMKNAIAFVFRGVVDQILIYRPSLQVRFTVGNDGALID